MSGDGRIPTRSRGLERGHRDPNTPVVCESCRYQRTWLLSHPEGMLHDVCASLVESGASKDAGFDETNACSTSCLCRT